MVCAPEFQLVIVPSRRLLMIASSEESTIAARKAAESSPGNRPSLLELGVFRPTSFVLMTQVQGHTTKPSKAEEEKSVRRNSWSADPFFCRSLIRPSRHNPNGQKKTERPRKRPQ